MRAILKTARLPKTYWAEAAKTIYYIINWSTSTTIEMKTPMEMWISKPVNFSFLHIFRCPVYVRYNDQERIKLDPNSENAYSWGILME